MTQNAIQITMENSLAIVAMNRGPENRLNQPFLLELSKAFESLKNDSQVRVVILTSALEKFFCNGYDLEWMMTHFNEGDTVKDFLEDTSYFLAELCTFPKPVIAVMNGHSFGEGGFMAGCCDYRIMREDRGWVCFPEVHINMPLIPGQIAILREILPPASFRDMAFFGRRYAALDALRLGFVDQVASAEEIMDCAKKLAEEMLLFNPEAFAEIKRRVRTPLATIMREQDPPMIQATINALTG